MAEEKMMCQHNPGKILTTLGVLTIVYGVINYLISAMAWAPYAAWIAGGVILLLVGWAKKSMAK
ncbi:MAG: hypothetical protein Q7R31_04590 [Candidatus Levybacteria bacterium]|nr:hypothetical protein [Candidatus Levybacteria bacterium]